MRRCRSVRSIPMANQNSLSRKSCIGTIEIHGLRFVSLRYFNAAGASENFGEDHRTETHLIPNVLKVALGQKPHVEIYGTDYETPDGTCIRDYIHILDLIARPHSRAHGVERVSSTISAPAAVPAFAKSSMPAAKSPATKIPVVEKPRRPGDPPRLIAASEKIKRELGWQPKFQSIDAIIESAWRWHQKFPNAATRLTRHVKKTPAETRSAGALNFVLPNRQTTQP